MRRTRLVLAAGVVLAAFIYVIVGGLRGAIVYYITPSELLVQGTSAIGKTTRLGGQVAPGSKQWNPNSLDLRFRLTDGTASVLVEHRGAPPDLFTEGQGAVVEGHYGPDNVFHATSIVVKHSEEYKPPMQPGKP